MIQSEYERAKRGLKQGDLVCLTLRGNYGNFIEEGKLMKIEHGYIYLEKGFAHHYRRIVSMSKFSEGSKEKVEKA